MADRIEDYSRNDVEVVAVLGGDVDSPGCAVHVHDGPMNLAPRGGIFMQELAAELQSRGLEVPFRGIRESRREAEFAIGRCVQIDGEVLALAVCREGWIPRLLRLVVDRADRHGLDAAFHDVAVLSDFCDLEAA